MNLLLTRILLSIWVLTPFGRCCGSISEVWMNKYLAVWGAPYRSSEMDIRDALALLRHYSFNGKYKGD